MSIGTANTLIFGTMYVGNGEKARLLDDWIECHRRLNQDCDVLLVDGCSPESALAQVAGLRDFERVHSDSDDLFDHSMKCRETLLSFRSNVGHLDGSGVDGWGRAFCQGIRTAIVNGYDYAVHVESDLLCRLKVTDVTRQMDRHRLNVVSAIDENYLWLETGLMFMRTKFLEDSAFVQRYDWHGVRQPSKPERLIARQLGCEVFYKNWPGFRNDFDVLTPAMMQHLVYVTHCRDASLYRHFMDRGRWPQREEFGYAEESQVDALHRQMHAMLAQNRETIAQARQHIETLESQLLRAVKALQQVEQLRERGVIQIKTPEP